MRIKNSMKNMIYVYTSTLLIAIMNFVVRRVFLNVLTVDYLGYDGLFNSIFSLLSLSEMGIASIITYHMYSEIASDNIFQIRKLLCIYKKIYRIVGGAVLLLGGIASLFLPLILREKHLESWGFIYTIYFLQLLATLCTYFLAYRRILFVTHQRIYVCTSVDTVGNIISIILKMVVLLVFRNYIIYLLIAIINNVGTNLVIAKLSKKEYPEITEVEVTREDMKDLNLFSEVKNMLATKVALTVYGGSDDIIITSILGIGTSGLLSNYRMISSKIQELILSMFNSLQASIGNLVYDKDKEKGESFFKALDLLGFFMALVCATGIITIGQPFIILWLKKDSFLLPDLFLLVFGLNLFVAITNNPITYFRNSLGHFEADRNYMIAAACTNLVVSIALAKPLGIAGVFIGTVLGHFFILAGRTKVVYKYYLNDNPVKYLLLFGFRLLILGISVYLSYLAAKIPGRLISNRIVSLLVAGLFSVIISSILFLLTSFKTDAFKVLLYYVKTVARMPKNRRKEGENIAKD